MIREEDLYRIGTLTRTHGVKGELSCSFTDDVWDRADADYVFLSIDGCYIPFFFEEWRFRSDSVCLFKFRDVDSIEQAEELCGAEVWFPKSQTPTDCTDEINDNYPLARLTGYNIIHEGRNIGTIARIDTTTANTLFELDNGNLISAAPPLIKEIDTQGRTVTMTLPEGLLE